MAMTMQIILPKRDAT